MPNLKKIYNIAKISSLLKIILLIVLAISISAILMVLYEKENVKTIYDAIWWAIVTISTVGYGDISPTTPAGKIIGVGLIFFGMVTISIFTATVSSILIERKLQEGKGLTDIAYKNHYILCGWNWNAEEILESLFNNIKNVNIVIVNELNPEDTTIILDKFRKQNLKFVKGDFSNLPILEKANIKHAKAVIIIPDNYNLGIKEKIDEKTIFATMTIKSVSEKIKVFAHILDKDKVPYIKRANVDEYFLPDNFSPFFLTSNIIAPGVNDIFKDLLSYKSTSKNIIRTEKIPATLVGKSFKEVSNSYKIKTNSILIGFIQMQDALEMKNIDENDPSSIDSFIKRKFSEAGRLTKDLEQKKIILNPEDNYIVNKHEYAVLISSKK